MSSLTTMDMDFKDELRKKGLDDKVIKYMETEEIYTPGRLANYVDEKSEIISLLLTPVPNYLVSRTDTSILTEVW